MRIALESLIDADLAAHVEECRAFNATSSAVSGPSTLEELNVARAARRALAAESPGPPAVEQVIEAAGRRMPVRILAPESATTRGVYLDIHGGGFYMGSAARRRRAQPSPR